MSKAHPRGTSERSPAPSQAPAKKLVTRVWLGVFLLWGVLLSGALHQVVGSPGAIQAIRLKNLLAEKQAALEKMQRQVHALEEEHARLATSQDFLRCEVDLRAGRIPNFTACGNNVGYSRRVSGNPDLKPEKSTNYNLGAVFEPTFLPSDLGRMTFTVDYWSIKQKGIVGILGNDTAVALDYLLRLQGSSNPNVIRDAANADDIAAFAGTGIAPVGRITTVRDQFINLLPQEFQPPSWEPKLHAPFMKVQNFSANSFITGEAGDNIGRGNRTSIYAIDEAAYLEHADQAEAALSQTTNCRIYVSTPNGVGNVFHRKAHDGKTKKFIFDWRDDPRKDQAWYDEQKAKLIAALTEAAVTSIDAPIETVRVWLTEVPLTQWGKDGKTMKQIRDEKAAAEGGAKP